MVETSVEDLLESSFGVGFRVTLSSVTLLSSPDSVVSSLVRVILALVRRERRLYQTAGSDVRPVNSRGFLRWHRMCPKGVIIVVGTMVQLIFQSGRSSLVNYFLGSQTC